jgi:hypothetical protein
MALSKPENFYRGNWITSADQTTLDADTISVRRFPADRCAANAAWRGSSWVCRYQLAPGTLSLVRGWYGTVQFHLDRANALRSKMTLENSHAVAITRKAGRRYFGNQSGGDLNEKSAPVFLAYRATMLRAYTNVKPQNPKEETPRVPAAQSTQPPRGRRIANTTAVGSTDRCRELQRAALPQLLNRKARYIRPKLAMVLVDPDLEPCQL